MVQPTPTETQIPPTATSAPIGLSRSNPFPSNEVANIPNWEVQVLEIQRGADALLDIQAANYFNNPPPYGMEYLSIKLRVKCLYDDDEEHIISDFDFDVTGDRAIRYTAGMAGVLSPEPNLYATLFAGGQTEGWATYLVSEGEGNFILVADESWVFEENNERYIALDPGASVTIPAELSQINPSQNGRDRKTPVPFKEILTTENWETSIVEVVRGAAAWSMVLEENQFNDPPKENHEYIAVKMNVRNISTEDVSQDISSYFYNLTGSENILYDLPSVVEPEPALDISLYPGGEYQGWVVFDHLIGETNLMFAFEETWSFESNVRYLALDEGASLEIVPELADISPTALWNSRSDPAPMSEIVVTDNWEISVSEVIRGADAWNMVLAANQFNDPPEDGFEYVAVKVKVRNIGTEDEAMNIDAYSFNTTGSAGVLHDAPSVVEPEPALSVYLFPGGEFEGWIIMQAAIDETNLLLIYEDWYSFSDSNKRYLSLEN
jgi:hypothetical protein